MSILKKKKMFSVFIEVSNNYKYLQFPVTNVVTMNKLAASESCLSARAFPNL